MTEENKIIPFRLKNFLPAFLEMAKIVIIALLIVMPIRYFLFQPFFVKGQSMEPNFYNGEYLIINEISYRFESPQRGDIIVFKYPGNPSQRYIKRIIGLPGETIEVKRNQIKIFPGGSAEPKILDESKYLPEGLVTTGDLKTALGINEYFVLGDNRLFSSDSRYWGTLSRENIIGKVAVRLWPFAALAKIRAPRY